MSATKTKTAKSRRKSDRERQRPSKSSKPYEAKQGPRAPLEASANVKVKSDVVHEDHVPHQSNASLARVPPPPATRASSAAASEKEPSKEYRVPDSERTTHPIMTKYELALLIGKRAEDLANNRALPFYKTEETNFCNIARKECALGIIPFVVRRWLPRLGHYEIWRVPELILTKNFSLEDDV